MGQCNKSHTRARGAKPFIHFAWFWYSKNQLPLKKFRRAIYPIVVMFNINLPRSSSIPKTLPSVPLRASSRHNRRDSFPRFTTPAFDCRVFLLVARYLSLDIYTSLNDFLLISFIGLSLPVLMRARSFKASLVFAVSSTSKPSLFKHKKKEKTNK